MHSITLHKNSFITNFKRKAQLFNSFFTKRCSLISNNSDIQFDDLQFFSKLINPYRMLRLLNMTLKTLC